MRKCNFSVTVQLVSSSPGCDPPSVRMAMDNSSSPEYAQLYNYLQESFQVGDVNGTGEVDEVNYDHMIEATIDAPRRGGAHKNQFASDEVCQVCS